MRRVYDTSPDTFGKPQFNGFFAEGLLERKGQNHYAKVKVDDKIDSAAG